MAHLMKWIMNPPVSEWAYDEEAQAIMVTTTTVVHTYFYPGRIYEEVEPDIPPAPAIVPDVTP